MQAAWAETERFELHRRVVVFDGRPAVRRKALRLLVLLFFLLNSYLPGDEAIRYEVRTSNLGNNLYLLKTSDQEGRVNVLVLIGADGVLLSDASFDAWSAEIRDAIKGLGGKDIRYVINTHFHSDHTDGNRSYGPEAAVIAHENVRKSLIAGEFPSPDPPLTGRELPGITFSDSILLYINDEEIEIVHYPNGHTGGDSVVFFRRSNVAHIGDLVLAARSLPYARNPESLLSNLDAILLRTSSDTRIVPGHGDLMSREQLRDVRNIVAETISFVRDYLESGENAAEISGHLPETWKEWNSPFLTMEKWIERLVRFYSQ